VTSIAAKTFNPSKAASTLFAQQGLLYSLYSLCRLVVCTCLLQVQGLTSAAGTDNENDQADLDKVAARGRFPSRPSDLFLKVPSRPFSPPLFSRSVAHVCGVDVCCCCGCGGSGPQDGSCVAFAVGDEWSRYVDHHFDDTGYYAALSQCYRNGSEGGVDCYKRLGTRKKC
jgi:hypothetical protein